MGQGKIKNVNLIAILAIVAVAFMSVGYAYVTGNEQSETEFRRSWDVYLNQEEYTSSGTAVDGTGPVISRNSIKFNVSFNNPGEYKTYVFEVLNTGDINAILKNITVTGEDTNTEGVNLTYTVYKDDNIITKSVDNSIDEQYNHLYRTYGTNIVEVTIMYNGEETQTTASANYQLNLVYTQVD